VAISKQCPNIHESFHYAADTGITPCLSQDKPAFYCSNNEKAALSNLDIGLRKHTGNDTVTNRKPGT